MEWEIVDGGLKFETVAMCTSRAAACALPGYLEARVENRIYVIFAYTAPFCWPLVVL